MKMYDYDLATNYNEGIFLLLLRSISLIVLSIFLYDAEYYP